MVSHWLNWWSRIHSANCKLREHVLPVQDCDLDNSSFCIDTCSGRPGANKWILNKLKKLTWSALSTKFCCYFLLGYEGNMWIGNQGCRRIPLSFIYLKQIVKKNSTSIIHLWIQKYWIMIIEKKIKILVQTASKKLYEQHDFEAALRRVKLYPCAMFCIFSLVWISLWYTFLLSISNLSGTSGLKVVCIKVG